MPTSEGEKRNSSGAAKPRPLSSEGTERGGSLRDQADLQQTQEPTGDIVKRAALAIYQSPRGPRAFDDALIAARAVVPLVLEEAAQQAELFLRLAKDHAMDPDTFGHLIANGTLPEQIRALAESRTPAGTSPPASDSEPVPSAS